MATVDLLINGVSYWADTVYESCHFESQVNGVAGPCSFRVRDPDRTKTFVPGQTILLTVDGSAVWRGFVSMVNRVFSFPALNVADFGLARFIDIVGTDINILLLKRIVSNQATPTNVEGPLVAAHTPDSTAIATLFAGWLDLSGDGLDTTTLVENVADTTWTESGTLWEGSDTWSQAMQSIANLPAAIYYIDPDKNFVYTDVDTPSAPFNLSDQPNGTTTRGYREMEVLKDGTGLANDVMAWGMGYGSQTPVFVRDTDATSQADHGLWQLAQISFGVYKQATIDRIAQSIIDGSPQNKRGAKNDRVAVQCVTYVPGLRPAQKVDFTSNAFGFNDVIPIRKMEIDFPAADTPKYTLTLSHEIDTPFGFFDPFLLHLPNPKCPPPLVMGPNGKCILPPIIHVGGCDCGITDTFTRTVASATNVDWGLCDAGLLWEFFAGGGVHTAAVDGSQGILTAGPDGATNAQSGQRMFPAWGLPIDIYFDLEFQNIPGGSNGATRFDFLWNTTSGSGATFFLCQGVLELNGSDITFAGSSSASGVSFTGQKRVRAQLDSVGIRLKYWDRASAEPAPWTIYDVWSGSPPTETFLSVLLRQSSSTATNLTALLDNFDVTVDITGINRCALVQFDDFNRTVAASSWGTATPSGIVWNNTGTISGGRTISVNGSQAYLGWVSEKSFAWGAQTDAIAGPWVQPAWVMTSLISIPSLPSDGSVFLLFDVIGYGRFHLGFSTDPTDAIQLENSFSDFSWSVFGGQYYVEWRVTYNGTEECRIWSLGSSRPTSPLITLDRGPSGDDPPATARFQVEAELLVLSLQSSSILLDFIDFDYAGKPCYPGGPPAGSGISSNAWACESFNPATTTITLAHSFLVNSPRVWLNGLLQPQSSYTQNGIAGTVTFDFTPLATDNARVCYWATA